MMTNHKAPKTSMQHNFPIRQRISGDRKTNRIQIVLPKGWRFNSLNTSEGRVQLSFKRVTAAPKASRATGYARDRQRLRRKLVA